MTAAKYIILTLIALVASALVVSMSGIDPMLSAFLAGGVLTNALRIGILVLLVTLLLTSPPRSFRLRMLSGAACGVMIIMSFVQLTAFNTYIIDAIIYLELAIIFAIEALELPLHTDDSRLYDTSRPQASS